MKFVVFVEGPTESRVVPQFIRRWLDPRLTQRAGVDAVNLGGQGTFLREIVRKARLTLDGPRSDEIVACVGLIDLYGPDFYPPTHTSAADRYAWGKAEIEARIDRAAFRQYFAVHELEAWILGQPTVLPGAVREALPSSCSRPESVNFNEHPAKLLNRLYRSELNRAYRKTVDAVGLFDRLEVQIVKDRCPYLGRMFDDLLEIAKARGL